MSDEKISELLKVAMQEPAAPKRLVERTCWKARAAEARFARETGGRKAGTGQAAAQKAKQTEQIKQTKQTKPTEPKGRKI